MVYLRYIRRKSTRFSSDDPTADFRNNQRVSAVFERFRNVEIRRFDDHSIHLFRFRRSLEDDTFEIQDERLENQAVESERQEFEFIEEEFDLEVKEDEGNNSIKRFSIDDGRAP